MALNIAPAPPHPFFTTGNLPVARAYVRIARLLYDKDRFDCTLSLEYYESEQALKTIAPRPESLTLRGLPREVVVADPLSILAGNQANAVALAYEQAAAAIRAVLGAGATIENAL
jgi:hypothetical protein